MAKNYIVDASTARGLLVVLELRGEVSEKDLNWALSIIHQIPGYEKASITLAASDRTLREMLIAVAAEEIAPTNPKDMQALLEEAKKREVAEKSARAEGEKKAKEFVRRAAPKEEVKVPPATEEGVKEEAPPKTPDQVKEPEIEVVQTPTPLAAEPQTPSVGIRISPSLFQAVEGLAKKTVFAPVTLPFNYFIKAGSSAVYGENKTNEGALSALTPFTLRAYGVDSRKLQGAVSSAKASGKISEDTSRKLMEVARAINKVETGSPWYIRTVFWAYGGNEVSLITDLDKVSGGGPFKSFLMAPTSSGGGFFISDAAGEIGQRALGGIFKKGIQNLLTKLGVTAATSGATAASGAAAGAAAGSVVPVVGTIIGAVVGWISSKLISWIAKHKEEFFAAIGAGVFVLGLLTGAVPLMVFGGLGFGLGAAGALGSSPGAVVSSAASGISAGIVGLASLTVASLSASAVVALVALPAVIAIILFIVNSGAYIVPPRVAIATLGAIESPYIGVEKIVNGASELENSELPAEVSYTITVTAKKGTLSNVRFDYKCEVVKEGATPNCPSVQIPSPPKIISPVESFSFTYSHNFDEKFEDSFVIDTMTVTADSPDAKNSSAAGSASVKIGAPPDDCPSGWPVHREGGEGAIPIKQGPHTSNGTHNVVEAIDISATVGHQVRAVHTGKVTVGNYGNYGDFVDVTSTCKTKKAPIKTVSITTRYAHLGTINVATGQSVNFGQTLGTSDTTGTAQAHLHYEFRPDGALRMETPYVPTTIPVACNNFDSNPGNDCGVFISN